MPLVFLLCSTLRLVDNPHWHSLFISVSWNHHYFNCSIDKRCVQVLLVFPAQCTLVQSAVLRSHVVRSSVRPSVCDVGRLWSHRFEISETKAAISLKHLKVEEKLLWTAYGNSPMLFWTVPSPTPYGLPFLEIGGLQPSYPSYLRNG